MDNFQYNRLKWTEGKRQIALYILSFKSLQRDIFQHDPNFNYIHFIL